MNNGIFKYKLRYIITILIFFFCLITFMKLMSIYFNENLLNLYSPYNLTYYYKYYHIFLFIFFTDNFLIFLFFIFVLILYVNFIY